MSLEKEDVERLKEIFVTRQECDTKSKEFTDGMNSIKIDLAVIKDNQLQNKWLSKTILAAVISLVVAAIWTLITGGIA